MTSWDGITGRASNSGLRRIGRSVSGIRAAKAFTDLNGFSDFFSTLFGGAGRSAAPPAAESDAGYLDVTVPEAFAGTKRRVMINANGRARSVDVQIPPGVTEGQSLRIAGSGGAASLLFRIRLLPHALYALQGKDVQIELPLAPWEAALGAKVAVPTLGGTVELTVPPGRNPDRNCDCAGGDFPAIRPAIRWSSSSSSRLRPSQRKRKKRTNG